MATLSRFAPLAACAAGLFAAATAAQPSSFTTAWTRHQAFPSPIGGAKMAFDSRRGRFVLFGGGDNAGPKGGGPLDEHWEGDVTGWQRRTPATKPPARFGHGLVYHAANERILLFGGTGYSSYYSGDTWEWDGQTWTQRFPGNSPPGRSTLGMAYDAARQRTVMYGGSTAGGGLHDTWEWDGTTWTRMWPKVRPAIYGGRMVYDAARQRVVLHTAVGGLGGQTWEWDGASWSQTAIATTPNTTVPALVYHEARQRTLLLDTGGRTGMWEYDGTTWTAIATEQSPIFGAIWGNTAGYDPVRRSVVLVGGYLNSYWGRIYHDRVWEYTSLFPARFDPVGLGCAGSAGVLGLAAQPGSWPWLGDTFELELAPVPGPASTAVPVGFLGSSSQLWGGVALPYGLGGIGAPECTLYTGIEIAVPLGPAVGGTTPWALSLPNDPTLVGARFFAQGMLLGDPVNAAQIVTSDAGQVRLGTR